MTHVRSLKSLTELLQVSTSDSVCSEVCPILTFFFESKSRENGTFYSLCKKHPFVCIAKAFRGSVVKHETPEDTVRTVSLPEFLVSSFTC